MSSREEKTKKRKRKIAGMKSEKNFREFQLHVRREKKKSNVMMAYVKTLKSI